MNFQGFTERARRALSNAETTAQRRHLPEVDTDLLAAAILNEEQGVAARAAGAIHPKPQTLLPMPEPGPGNGEIETLEQPPLDTQAKACVARASAQARDMNHSYIGTEHLLLGILAHGQSNAARTLAQAGITQAALEKEVIRILNPYGTPKAPTNSFRETAQSVARRTLQTSEDESLDQAHRLEQANRALREIADLR